MYDIQVKFLKYAEAIELDRRRRIAYNYLNELLINIGPSLGHPDDR